MQIISAVSHSRSFELQAEVLKDSGMSLHYVLLNSGPSNLENFLRALGIPVTRINLTGKKSWPMVFCGLIMVIYRYRPAIVHCHLFDATLLGLIASRVLGVKRCVFTRHHGNVFRKNFVTYNKKGLIWDFLTNILATEIVANSQTVKEILVRDEGVSPKKVTVQNYMLPIEEFQQKESTIIESLKEKYNLKSASLVVGAVSRLDEWKGVEYTVSAFSKLILEFPQALLMIANARGTQERKIRNMLKDLPSKSWRLIEFEENMSALYHCFDVFVHVPIDSDVEAFGQVYIEALAAEIPCIFSSSGIANEIEAEDEVCLFVPHKDGQAIYQALTKILRDELFKSKVTQRGYEYALGRFSAKVLKEDLLLFYKDKAF